MKYALVLTAEGLANRIISDDDISVFVVNMDDIGMVRGEDRNTEKQMVMLSEVATGRVADAALDVIDQIHEMWFEA